MHCPPDRHLGPFERLESPAFEPGDELAGRWSNCAACHATIATVLTECTRCPSMVEVPTGAAGSAALDRIGWGGTDGLRLCPTCTREVEG